MKKSLIKNRKSVEEYLKILRHIDANEDEFFAGSKGEVGWDELERKVYAFIGEIMAMIHPVDFFYSNAEDSYCFSFVQFVQKRSSLEKNNRIVRTVPTSRFGEGKFELEVTEITFSSHGQLVVVDGEEHFDEEAREILEKALEKYGFIWIPYEVALLKCDGGDECYKQGSDLLEDLDNSDNRPTWDERFFSD